MIVRASKHMDVVFEEAASKQKQLNNQVTALKLVHDYYMKGGRKLLKYPGVITEALVHSLRASAARLWILDGGEYKCIDQYDALVRYHPEVGAVPDCLQDFFRRKQMGKDLHMVPDVLNAGLPADLEAYYDTHGVHSLMFSPIYLDETLGFLTAANYSPREWQADEQTFAMALSDFVALCLTRQELKEKQGQLNHLFANIPGLAFKMRYCPDGAVFDFLSESSKSIAGFSQEEARGKKGILKEYIYFEDFENYHKEHTVLREVGDTLEQVFRCRFGGQIRWALEKSRVIDVDPVKCIVTYEGLVLDITERVRLREIETAAEANNIFMSVMSNEIKTPLNSLIGFSHLLAKTGLTQTQEDYLMKVQSASVSLLRIINSILESSNIGNEKRGGNGE